MKTNFDDMSQQMSYINRFIERNTNFKKKCIVCGKPATIQHNKINPYIIRPLCRICRNQYGLFGRTVDKTLNVLPTVNLLDYVNTKPKRYEDRVLTQEEMCLIDECIKLNLTKTVFSQRLNTHFKGLDWMIDEYEKIKPGIKEQFLQSIKKGRRNALLEKSLRQDYNTHYNTKIIKLKREKNLSTKDIVKLANNEISTMSLNLIIEGKIEANDKFKKVIAEALDVQIEDIF